MSVQLERAGALAKVYAGLLQRVSRSSHFVARCIVICGLLLSAAQAQNRTSFDIDAGPASQSLNLYAQQAQVQLGFSVDVVGDIHTNPVKGEYESAEALELLLAGTGLAAEHGEKGIIIHETAASETNSEPASPSTDAASLQFNQTAVQVGAAEAPTSGGGSNTRSERTSKPLEEIVVTGSNIRGAGNVGAAAISFNREELAKTGFSTVEELFESLPQNLNEITPIGAIATGASFLAGFNTQGASSINLRGLGPGSTLVLLNGKRRPGNINGRVVDVSAIPFAMVERVELVTGGHSAIYGSDAVAGVVNIVTRKDYDGAETQVYYGQSSAGGERLNLNQTFGKNFDNGGFVLGYDYRKDQPLDATDTGVLRSPSPAGLAPIPGLFHIRGAAEQHVGLLAGRYDLSPKVEIYADAQFAAEEYKNQLAYQIGGCCDLDIYRVTDSIQYSAVGGSRFDLGRNWRIDVSALHGIVDNTAAVGSAFTSPEGTITSADPRPVANAEDDDEAKLASLSAVADGPLGTFGNRTVSAAIGVDFRSESYLNSSTDLVTGTTETFEDIDREAQSIFGEVHIPLLPRDKGRLEVSLAGRYDDYSDFGDTFNPQVGVEWEPVRGFALRGSFSQAFRAPNLFELSNETRVRIATLVDPLDPTGATTATVFVHAGGNSDLQPEKADSYTLGVDWEPLDGAKLTASYFNIEYDGRIDTPDSFSGGFAALENEALYPDLIERNPTPDQVDAIVSRAALIINNSGIPFDPATDNSFTTFPNIIIFDNRSNNISSDAIDGFDIQASAAWENRFGDWSLGLNGTRYLDFERNITAASPTITQLNQPGKPVDLRLRGHVGWSGLAWNAQVYVNYVDSYDDNTVDPSIPIDSWTTIDLTIGLEASEILEGAFLDGFSAAFGVNNLFDEDPPVLLNNDLGLGYDAVNANAVGRFVSLRLSKRW